MNWRYEGEKPVSHQVEHDEFFADLRAGKTPNDGQRMAQSTMMGIMGRMSAYTGKEVTWDFAMKSKLATMPEKLAWDMKLPKPKPAEPGKTPLVWREELTAEPLRGPDSPPAPAVKCTRYQGSAVVWLRRQCGWSGRHPIQCAVTVAAQTPYAQWPAKLIAARLPCQLVRPACPRTKSQSSSPA